jgi:hypothetical protein
MTLHLIPRNFLIYEKILFYFLSVLRNTGDKKNQKNYRTLLIWENIVRVYKVGKKRPYIEGKTHIVYEMDFGMLIEQNCHKNKPRIFVTKMMLY